MATYDYEENFVEALKDIPSHSLKRKLVAMKNIVVKRLQIEREFKDLHNKLEAKYEALYKPIYEKRSRIIDGTEVINSQDIQENMAKLDIKDSNEPEDNKEQGIPEYWGKAIANTDQFAPFINEKDKKILKHLTNITADIQETGDFTLNFTFSANEYFDATLLTKEHILNKKDLSIEKIISTQISWKSEEMNPTVEKKTKKIKNKKTKDVKTVTKTEEVPSFFNFFKSYDVTGKTKNEAEDEDEEDEFEIISDEYELALFVKEELIPYSIEYYLDMNKNEADEMDEDEEFEDEDE
jgi:nucleosome assembly protein 1-like 1